MHFGYEIASFKDKQVFLMSDYKISLLVEILYATNYLSGVLQCFYYFTNT
jgi:hypothetical protein